MKGGIKPTRILIVLIGVLIDLSRVSRLFHKLLKGLARRFNLPDAGNRSGDWRCFNPPAKVADLFMLLKDLTVPPTTDTNQHDILARVVALLQFVYIKSNQLQTNFIANHAIQYNTIYNAFKQRFNTTRRILDLCHLSIHIRDLCMRCNKISCTWMELASTNSIPRRDYLISIGSNTYWWMMRLSKLRMGSFRWSRRRRWGRGQSLFFMNPLLVLYGRFLWLDGFEIIGC